MIKKTVQGFLMIELLVAIVLMAIVSLIFVGYYTKTVIIQKDTELYLQATTIISSALEKVLAEKKLPEVQQKVGVFTLDWHKIPNASLPALKNNFVTVEAVISWQSMMKIPKKITMVSAFATGDA